MASSQLVFRGLRFNAEIAASLSSPGDAVLRVGANGTVRIGGAGGFEANVTGTLDVPGQSAALTVAPHRFKMKLILALLAAPAVAFVAPAAPRAGTAVQAVQDMEGITMPIGLFDPLGFSNGASAEALQWYREAELKHGRVAMAAFVGFLVNYQGITFPADLTMSGEKFSSLGTGNPLLAWDNISDKGKWSILGFIGLLEVLGEAEKPHYMRGGKSGTHDLVWYFGSKYLSGKTEEQKLRSRTAEINNGRLAMIGIMGFIAASTVPGSVPYFTEDLTQYSGSVWAPF